MNLLAAQASGAGAAEVRDTRADAPDVFDTIAGHAQGRIAGGCVADPPNVRVIFQSAVGMQGNRTWEYEVDLGC